MSVSGLSHSVRSARVPPIRTCRFRGGLVFKAHRLLYHSSLGLMGLGCMGFSGGLRPMNAVKRLRVEPLGALGPRPADPHLGG